MSREIYLFAAGLLFLGALGLAYMAYGDHASLVELRDVVEVEANVLRIKPRRA